MLKLRKYPYYNSFSVCYSIRTTGHIMSYYVDDYLQSHIGLLTKLLIK